MWKPIKGYEGVYEISSWGEVKSLSRLIPYKARMVENGKRLSNDRILKPALTWRGYEFVTLRKNNKTKSTRIHQLVIKHFLRERPKGYIIHHKDGDKRNNRIENLAYVTHYYNTREYHRKNGSLIKGTIPIEDIPAIKDRANNGEKIYSIAKEYNVSRDDIATIVSIISLTEEELKVKELVK